MRVIRVFELGMLLGLLLISALPFTAASSPVTARHPLSVTSELTVAPGFVPMIGTRTLGSYGGIVEVAIELNRSNTTSIASDILSMYTPGSIWYHRFLTASDVATRYGDPGYAAAVAYFKDRGLVVQTSPDRTFLAVVGSARLVGAAFHTGFDEYQRNDGTWFYDHAAPAMLPAWLNVTGVYGLGNQTEMIHYDRIIGSRSVSTPSSTTVMPDSSCSGMSLSEITACGMQTAYNESTTLLTHNGSGQVIGIVDAYDIANATVASDMGLFDSANGLPAAPLNVIRPFGGNPVFGWNIETSLDVEWSHAMAPGATINLTLAPNAGAGLYAAVDAVVAAKSANVVSMSWGEPVTGIVSGTGCVTACNATSDGSYELLEPVFQAAAMEGITMFAASGDCGANGGTPSLAAGWPAASDWVTGVGGTVLTVNATGVWDGETGWSGNPTSSCGNQGGSGGGYAPWKIPWWQKGTGLGAATHRGVPDVSADAAGFVYVYSSGTEYAVGGTSLASPLWAGMTAVMNAVFGAPLGYLNPMLYTILRNSTAYAKDFHDIRSGNNGYSATAGWDPVTGLGSPNITGLITSLTTTSVSAGFTSVLHVSPRSVYSKGFVSWSVASTGGAAPYTLWDVGFGSYQPAGLFDSGSFASPTGVFQYPAVVGVFTVQAIVVDGSGNYSVTQPLAVLSGSSSTVLTFTSVTLSPSTNTPTRGATVTFTAASSPSEPGMVFTYYFGDGTYTTTSATTATHAYAVNGAYCATVIGNATAGGGSSNGVGLGVGTSAPSCPANGTGQTGYTTVGPAAPTGFKVTGSTATTLSLAWTNPTGSVVTDTVYVSSSCTSLLSATPISIPVTSAYTITGLSPFQVRCVGLTANFTYAASPLSATILTHVPGAITGLTASNSNGNVNLAWTRPAGEILNVTVQYRTGGCSGTVHNVSAGNVSSLTISGLTTGSVFCFDAIAWNGSGASTPSNSQSVIPLNGGSGSAGAVLLPSNDVVILVVLGGALVVLLIVAIGWRPR